MKRPHDDLRAGTPPELAFAFRELRRTDRRRRAPPGARLAWMRRSGCWINAAPATRHCQTKWRVWPGVEIHPMSSDHNRLEALRRITVKRGATKAEAATAKRLADELRPCPSRRPRGGGASGSSGSNWRCIRSRWPGSGCMGSGPSASSAWCSCPSLARLSRADFGALGRGVRHGGYRRASRVYGMVAENLAQRAAKASAHIGKELQDCCRSLSNQT